MKIQEKHDQTNFTLQTSKNTGKDSIPNEKTKHVLFKIISISRYQ